jgi:hypothetical protein
VALLESERPIVGDAVSGPCGKEVLQQFPRRHLRTQLLEQRYRLLESVHKGASRVHGCSGERPRGVAEVRRNSGFLDELSDPRVGLAPREHQRSTSAREDGQATMVLQGVAASHAYKAGQHAQFGGKWGCDLSGQRFFIYRQLLDEVRCDDVFCSEDKEEVHPRLRISPDPGDPDQRLSTP